MAKNVRRLGRGLSSLISKDLTSPPAIAGEGGGVLAGAKAPMNNGSGVGKVIGQGGASSALGGHHLLMISVDRVRENPKQPRRHFGAEALAALAESLKARGVLQPVIVRPAAEGYELVAGERRLRAARLAGLTELPAIVRQVPDHELLELALIENVQRADLNPVERARGYQALHRELGLSHAQIAERMAEDRATVANYIRLLGLCEEVLEMVAEAKLSMGHAKAILGTSDPRIQCDIARSIQRQGWSVRRTEAEIAKHRQGKPTTRRQAPGRPAVVDMEERLSAAVGTRVQVREGKRPHAGELVISYYNLDDFERITGLLGVTTEAP